MGWRARLRRAWGAIMLASASAAGHVVRAAPGTVGALLMSYGLWSAWPPLGFLAAGVFLLLMDRRMP